jgi:hypothetical protein
MKLTILGRSGTDWYGQRSNWVEGLGGDAKATLSPPAILFDDRMGAGSTGQYLIYSQWERSGSEAVMTELIRGTPHPAGYFWTAQMMQNQWTTTRSAPSATIFGDDIAWGWRVNETFPIVPNILQVFLKGSGITDNGITDFDDVTWISQHGLQNSLRSVAR